MLGSGVAAGVGEVFLQIAAVARLRNLERDGVAEATRADVTNSNIAQVGGVGITPVRGRMKESDVCEVVTSGSSSSSSQPAGSRGPSHCPLGRSGPWGRGRSGSLLQDET